MIPPGSTAYKILDPIADAVDPALAIAAIVLAVSEWRRGLRKAALAYFVATALGLASIYAVMAIDHSLLIWQRFGGDYSTHTAFAASLVISMMMWRRSWRVGLVAVLLGYAALIVIIGYHRAVDVFTSGAVAMLITFPWHVAARKFTR